MQTNLIHIGPQASLHEAARLMAEHRISGLPVIDAAGKAVGVVTLADLSAAWLHLRRSEVQDVNFYRNMCGQSEALADYFALFYADETGLTVADVMTPKVLHVSENVLVTEIITLLQEHRVHRVFISRDHQLVGVVTTMDVMQAIPRLLG